MADLTKYRFPNNTAVIAITTHGAIQTVKDNTGADEIVTFEVPEGMTITKMSVSPIGICNMASEDDSTNMVRTVSSIFSDPDPRYKFEERMGQLVPKLKELQKGIETNVSKNQTPGVKKDELDYEFLVYADRAQAVKTYNQGEKLINKIYVKNPGEGRDHPFDFKMPILNQPNNPDFLQLLVTGRMGPETRSMGLNNEQFTTLSYIAGVLRWQCQVKHLILFDYSCSSFYDDEMSKTLQRKLAREANAMGYGGKKRKTRRRKNKTKTRKAKKMTLSRWSH